MNAVVADTDVVSLVFKGDSRAEKYLSALAVPDLLVSFMTEAELERWINPGQVGTRANHSFPNLHEAFCFCAVFPRPDRQVGGGDGGGALAGPAN
jgi:hypothetical protein